jgi:predicted NBD/HSP70 family sugar kinase
VALGALVSAAGLDPGADVEELAGRAEAGEQRALDALAAAGHWLGVGVASAANVLDPRGIVLGGYLATLAPWLAPGIEEELAAHLLGADWARPDVLQSTLGADPAVRGASALALRRVYDDPGVVAELARA